MFDAFNLPQAFVADVQIFTRPSTVTNTQWLSWHKPRGVAVCNILCIGGGGGGGGGFSGVAAGAGGGGSGGSSGVSRVELPVAFLPDKLFIQVGAGGVGGLPGAPATAGANGVLSYVAVGPDTTAINVVALSGAAAAVGGANGTNTAGGAGGAASTIAVIGSMPLAGLGAFNLIAGQVGVIGGDDSGANGTAITIPITSTLCQAGSGGAGTTASDTQGGECTAISNSWLSEQRPATPAAGSFNGSDGPQIWKPFFSFGGLGGSGSVLGIAGTGGNGAHGGGGGGGGGGATGGSGGDGGAGIVIITSW
jgi:hypothetical protein